MKRFLDNLRAIFVSPEMMTLCITVATPFIWPGSFQIVVSFVTENLLYAIGAASLPSLMLVWSWTQVWKLLSPSGKGRDLLNWPDYQMLKDRTVIGLGWCVIGAILVIAGVGMIEGKWCQGIGAGLILGGIVVAGVATFSLALARLRVRELLNR